MKPWATIISVAPPRAHHLAVISPTNIILMCTTEEYAITTFKSMLRKQKNLVIALPMKAM